MLKICIFIHKNNGVVSNYIVNESLVIDHQARGVVVKLRESFTNFSVG